MNQSDTKTELRSEVVELGSQVLPRPVLSRMPSALQLGSTAQAAVPGLYAWFVTVVPCAWSRGGNIFGKISCILALFSLATAIYLEPQQPRIARIVSVWGLSTFSLVVWMISPSPLEPQHFASTRALSGMLGWGLFAYASAAPALGPRAGGPVEPGVLKPRSKVVGGDVYYLTGGALLAMALQTIGWHVLVPERALLVRAVLLAAGLGVVGAAASLSLARRLTVRRAPSKTLQQTAVIWALAVGLLLVVGAVIALLR